jgi:hypothetical protein
MRAVRRVALNPGYIGLRGHHGQITESLLANDVGGLARDDGGRDLITGGVSRQA